MRACVCVCVCVFVCVCVCVCECVCVCVGWSEEELVSILHSFHVNILMVQAKGNNLILVPVWNEPGGEVNHLTSKK